MKIEMLEPSGDCTPDVVADSLSLLAAEHHVPAALLVDLSPIELTLIFDWATREQLAASDNRIRRRPKPHLLGLIVRLAQATSDLEEAQAHAVDVEESVH